MATHNPFRWRRLILLIAAAVTCSFVTGIASYVRQPMQPMLLVTESTQQTSPFIPIPPESLIHPIEQEAGKPEVPVLAENKSAVASPQPDSITSPLSLNSDSPGGSSTQLGQAVPSPESNDVVSETLAGRQFTTIFSVPPEFQAKVTDRLNTVGQEKVIALTFDDGPSPYNTSKVLDILDKNSIKATFFFVGQSVKDYPQLAQKVVAAGHAIGNHTWHHSYHPLDPVTAAREIEDTAEIIYKTTGILTFLFRPPGGLLNNGVADYAKQKNYAVVMWSVDAMDYRPFPAEKLVNNVIGKVQPGMIILMHDGGGNHPATVQALPDIVTKLKERGYKFVTVPELFAMKEIVQSEIMVKTQLSDPLSSPNPQP